MKEKATPWKLVTDSDYSAWVLYRNVEEPGVSRLQTYPQRYKNRAEALRKADELNGAD
ncbi:hypothetical protein [Acidaminococcus sp.]|uniref:hypothetical protein n=1 Tax=Acidaminococcus sp. TaxID=1872103 RepID=UPI003D7D98C0